MTQGNQKNLTLNGLTIPNFIHLLVGLGMVIASAYLTKHFFQLHFPEGLANQDTLCNINGFWGCDKAALSPLGSILNVPTSLFGLIIGVMVMAISFIGSEAFEKTGKFIAGLNLIGCLVLLGYSLFILKGLCPFCTVYYVMSGILFFLYHKYSDLGCRPEVKPLGIYAVLILVPSLAMANYYSGKKEKESSLSQQYINQFNSLKTYGDPAIPSEFMIYSSTEKFEDAPIRISVFSDFQCPYCQMVGKQMTELIEEFKGKINIQYFFYPLDPSCNSAMKAGGHPYACKAAYLAACDQTKFAKIHDYIFDHQTQLNNDSLRKWEKDFGLSGCFDNKKAQEAVQTTLSAGTQYQIKSTPTVIINGKKLEGLVPTVYLKAILKTLKK